MPGSTPAAKPNKLKQLGVPGLNLHGTGLGESGLPVKPIYVVRQRE